MDKKKLFLAIGIFWAVVILSFIAIKEFTLQTGTEVLLKTVPVDPRDMFRGDYVVLNYEISNLDSGTLKTDSTGFSPNDNVYVALDKSGEYGVAAGIYSKAPEGLFIKGIVKSVSNNRLTVEYGIESYFVPEGEGRKIEAQSGTSLDAKVSIDQFGNAAIKTLLIDGKDVKFG